MKRSVWPCGLAALCLCLCLCLLFLPACGRYYSCDVAGYVRDTDSGVGVNGARVRMYNSEPDDAEDEGYIVETTSMTSGGNAGYFSHKIIWNAWFGSFGDEGDTGEIWLAVTHEDYQTLIVQRTGLLSDTLNVVADLSLERASFEATSLEGRIVDSSGSGVNGVRVVLDLASTDDTTSDYAVISRTSNGVEGVFTFTNMRWRDETPDSAASDTEAAGLYVDDNNYDSVYTQTNQLSLTLQSGDESVLDSNIPVTHIPRTIYTASFQGRCLYRTIAFPPDPPDVLAEVPISGVVVTVTFTDDNGDHKLYGQTGANGYYNFTIEWEDELPLLDDDGTVTIPEGEDGIPVTISFSSNSTPGNVYSFDDIDDFYIRSWFNTNQVPDSIDLDMLS